MRPRLFTAYHYATLGGLCSGIVTIQLFCAPAKSSGAQSMSAQIALLALGANMEGPFGGPVKTFVHAIQMLGDAGVQVQAASAVYLTDPVGPGWQSPYHNAVVRASWSRGPTALLRLAKRIERACGRRPGPVWGPRVLDIDVIHHGARIVGWPVSGRWSHGLTLPHRRAAARAFVIIPLAAVSPGWRHPVTGARACDLARRMRGRKGRIREVVASSLPVSAEALAASASARCRAGGPG